MLDTIIFELFLTFKNQQHMFLSAALVVILYGQRN